MQRREKIQELEHDVYQADAGISTTRVNGSVSYWGIAEPWQSRYNFQPGLDFFRKAVVAYQFEEHPYY